MPTVTAYTKKKIYKGGVIITNILLKQNSYDECSFITKVNLSSSYKNSSTVQFLQ